MPSYNDQDSCQELPPRLSASEAAALQILEGYGIDFAPCYIGRARRYFAQLRKAKVTAELIVEQVIHEINYDEEQRLKETHDLSKLYDSVSLEAQQQVELKFWQKLIADEVTRLRFNKGFEPVEIDLYPDRSRHGFDYLGRCRIGSKSFRATAVKGFDEAGNEILALRLNPE